MFNTWNDYFNNEYFYFSLPSLELYCMSNPTAIGAPHFDATDQHSVASVKKAKCVDKDYLSTLPKQLLINIMSRCQPTTLCKLSTTSKLMNLMSNTPLLWRKLCLEYDLNLLFGNERDWKVVYKNEVYEEKRCKGLYRLSIIDAVYPRTRYTLEINLKNCTIKHLKKVLTTSVFSPYNNSSVIILSHCHRLNDDEYVCDILKNSRLKKNSN